MSTTPATVVALGTENFVKAEFWIAILGLVIAAGMMVRRISGQNIPTA
ncbi:MAG: hypothetical protein NZ879_07230 [Archaeoglobaceae archaeon]|nr:hypothetical protein [Archaeoglobaceae archaeon]MDW8118758.1 hypothetical protein [Archaeoglobaceae archaeon]